MPASVKSNVLVFTGPMRVEAINLGKKWNPRINNYDIHNVIFKSCVPDVAEKDQPMKDACFLFMNERRAAHGISWDNLVQGVIWCGVE